MFLATCNSNFQIPVTQTVANIRHFAKPSVKKRQLRNLLPKSSFYTAYRKIDDWQVQLIAFSGQRAIKWTERSPKMCQVAREGTLSNRKQKNRHLQQQVRSQSDSSRSGTPCITAPIADGRKLLNKSSCETDAICRVETRCYSVLTECNSAIGQRFSMAIVQVVSEAGPKFCLEYSAGTT